MDWNDIACILFICVSANHLGLIKAAEEVLGFQLPILNCCKCSTYWAVLTYSVLSTHDIIGSLAVSFLCAYVAIWLELLMGFIDFLYLKVYEKIYSRGEDSEITADTYGSNTNGTMSEL